MKVQEIAPLSEKRPARAWLAHEIVQLREMYERGESVAYIAKALDSTEWRVRRTATRYRIFRTPSSAAAHALTPALAAHQKRPVRPWPFNAKSTAYVRRCLP